MSGLYGGAGESPPLFCYEAARIPLRSRTGVRHRPNRSLLRLGHAGMVTDRGAPVCHACGQALHFDSDRQGRTTESCGCGYDGYVLSSYSVK